MSPTENGDEPFVEETNEAARNAFNIINVLHCSIFIQEIFQYGFWYAFNIINVLHFSMLIQEILQYEFWYTFNIINVLNFSMSIQEMFQYGSLIYIHSTCSKSYIFQHWLIQRPRLPKCTLGPNKVVFPFLPSESKSITDRRPHKQVPLNALLDV